MTYEMCLVLNDRVQVWTLMSQRLQAAMLDISSSRHQYQHQQHLQQITPQASTSLLPPVQAGAVGAVQVQTSCVAEEPEEHGPRRGKESICCGSQSTSSRAASKKMQQQQSQHRSQPLPSPHPLMPALLEKVRAAASLPPETVSHSHASKQQSQLRPKERFKGPHDCSFTTSTFGSLQSFATFVRSHSQLLAQALLLQSLDLFVFRNLTAPSLCLS